MNAVAAHTAPPKFIFFNGPPRSGKNAVAERLLLRYPEWRQTALAEQLKLQAHAAYGLFDEDITGGDPTYPANAFENTKDQPSKFFNGQTPRQAYIAYGEWSKQLLGKDIWSRTCREYCHANPAPVWLITDLGFPEDLEAFTSDSFAIVQLSRDGCDFSNDSRSYVKDNRADLLVQLDNNRPLAATVHELDELLQQYLS